MVKQSNDINKPAEEVFKPIDRDALVKSLKLIINGIKDGKVPMSADQLRSTATDALQLLEDYDGVLRGLAFSLSAGGYNSEGLIEPHVAEDKIRWGINYMNEKK